jgi:hypothetical protein
MSHTPGPWFNVDDSFIRARFPHQNGEHVATVWSHGAAQTAANARLIAAAPDLLAASKLILRSFAYPPGRGPEWFEAARAAVVKADGVSP